MLESTLPISWLWIWDAGVEASGVRSARARFLVFLLWTVKMSDLDFEGRGRAAEVLVWGFDRARRELSWEVKARVVEEEISLTLEDLVGPVPYKKELEVMAIQINDQFSLVECPWYVILWPCVILISKMPYIMMIGVQGPGSCNLSPYSPLKN